MKYTLSTLFILGLIFGSLSIQSCKAQTETPADDPDTSYFGEKITAENAISYDQLLTELAQKDSLAVKVEGVVESVCQSKGCWINIVSTENPESETMFVKFKDYGFFLPKDCAGKTVIMEGTAYREQTSVEELRHYAEDEGKSVEEIEAITEPVEELKFMASGVILKNM